MSEENSIYLTQLIYLKDGEEQTFEEFENMAIPVISRYNGELLVRIRPTADSYITHTIEQPYEIHLVRFDTLQDFENFQKDDERKQFLHFKEKAIKATLLIQGTKW